MRPGRETTVLFADVAGSTTLYEQAGDRAAADGIYACLSALRSATEASGGRVVKNIGDEIMALFPNADLAAEAATRMHVAMRTLPPLAGHAISLRIAFHAGPVVQRGDDVFGDTVNLASRLVAQACKGQVLTSAQTVKKLTPALQNSTRQLYDITVKGKAADVSLCELLWSKGPDVTDFRLAEITESARRPRLRLKFGDREVIRRRLSESITIGRDPDSTFVLHERTTSRRHCTIERKHHNFVLRDHSANGTFVFFVQRAEEVLVRREEVVLQGRGWLTLGQRKGMTTDSLEYFCEDDAPKDASQKQPLPVAAQLSVGQKQPEPRFSLDEARATGICPSALSDYDLANLDHRR